MCLPVSSGIMPNMETKVLLVQIFGEKGHPMRKYQRIMYWFPKFKHMNPFPIPHQLPEDPVDLARLALTRIANDLDAKVTVYQVTFGFVKITFRAWRDMLVFVCLFVLIWGFTLKLIPVSKSVDF